MLPWRCNAGADADVAFRKQLILWVNLMTEWPERAPPERTTA